jgi:3-oxoacyl-[acyl-carrier protein] reductase
VAQSDMEAAGHPRDTMVCMGALTGKSAVVTGGTRGIGRAVAERLLDEGASVAICGKAAKSTETAVRALSSHGNAIGQACDVADPASVHSFFEFVAHNVPGLDILINNAGVGVFRPTGELTIDDWRRVLETNLSGVFYCSRQALPIMKRGGRGYIINISSLAGKNPFAGGAAYNASKFGVNGFSEAMMLDHRQDNIRVSYVMPGSVSTEFASGAGADWKIAPEDIAEIVMSLLRMPERTLISRVEVRPAKPQK